MYSIPLVTHAREVADRVLAEEEKVRRHLVVVLSGAHAYGFPSPDSDLDLKAIHVAPTRQLLGLHKITPPRDRLEWIEKVEIDYSSNEIGGVLAQILRGNGNYIERVWGKLCLLEGKGLADLRALIPSLLSKCIYNHYRGFASGQRKELAKAKSPTAKRLLYVLRTGLTGTHLLRTGELRVDLSTVARDYGFEEAEDLIATERAGEQVTLTDSQWQTWQPRLNKLFATLDDAHDHSSLPTTPSVKATEEANDWLVALREAELR